jgi:hypothetical protein
MGYSHIWKRFNFHGTYGAFLVAKDGMIDTVCNVAIEDGSVFNHEETRAYRRDLKRKGKKVPALRRDTLHDELVVVIGPKMSAASAVKRLRDVIKQIEKEGALIGYDMDGDYVFEKADGTFHE